MKVFRRLVVKVEVWLFFWGGVLHVHTIYAIHTIHTIYNIYTIYTIHTIYTQRLARVPQFPVCHNLSIRLVPVTVLSRVTRPRHAAMVQYSIFTVTCSGAGP